MLSDPPSDGFALIRSPICGDEHGLGHELLRDGAHQRIGGVGVVQIIGKEDGRRPTALTRHRLVARASKSDERTFAFNIRGFHDFGGKCEKISHLAVNALASSFSRGNCYYRRGRVTLC